MAGMFYTLAEVAGKLSKSENDVKEMVKSGQLREFRDGSKLLFKKDEVDALTADTAAIGDDTMLADDTNVGSTMGGVEDLELGLDSIGQEDLDEDIDMDLDLSIDEDEQAELNVDLDMDENPIEAAAETSIEESIEALDDDTKFDFSDENEDELELADKTAQEAEPLEELTIKEESQEDPPIGLTEEDIALAEGLSPDTNAESDIDFSLESDVADAPAENLDEIGIADDSEFDINLTDSAEQDGEPELASSDAGFDITDDGTKLGHDGINVLDESDPGYDLANDPLGETAEVKLKDDNALDAFDDEAIIEDDVNLESFGSGSGLLDLSLQADDTSLGAVLDDIIPGAGGGEEVGGGGFDFEAGADDMLSEAEDVDDISSGATDVDMEAISAESPVQSPTSRTVAAITYVAPQADTASNAFGASLIIPLVALIYMGIVVAAAIADVAVGALTAMQDMIWYIMGSMLVVALIVVGIGAMSGQGGSKKTAKVKSKTAKSAKAKARKSPKPKKPKKAKKK